MQYEITYDSSGLTDYQDQPGWQSGWSLATGQNGYVYLKAVILKKQVWTFNEDGSIQNSEGKYLSIGEVRDGQSLHIPLSMYAKLTTEKINLFDILIGGKICLRGTNYTMIAHRIYSSDKVSKFITLVAFHNKQANKWKLTQSFVPPIQYSYTPSIQPTISSVFCSYQFQIVLISKGIKDETIAKLKDEGITSIELLRQCTEQMLQTVGIKMAEVIALKKL